MMTFAFQDFNPPSLVSSGHNSFERVRALVAGVPAAVHDEVGDQEEAAYFRRRAAEEQLAARRANCTAARDRHDQLALLYRFRSAMLASPLGIPIERLRDAAAIA